MRIETLYGEAEPGAEEAWQAVIERRVEELDKGAVEAVPWSEVRERLFRVATTEPRWHPEAIEQGRLVT